MSTIKNCLSVCPLPVQAFDAAVRQGKSPHYLTTDFIAAQQPRDKRRSFSKDSSRRGSRESLDSMADSLALTSDDVSISPLTVPSSRIPVLIKHLDIGQTLETKMYYSLV